MPNSKEVGEYRNRSVAFRGVASVIERPTSESRNNVPSSRLSRKIASASRWRRLEYRQLVIVRYTAVI